MVFTTEKLDVVSYQRNEIASLAPNPLSVKVTVAPTVPLFGDPVTEGFTV
jgi:hypothetical protein